MSTSFMNSIFGSQRQPKDPWFLVGRASSFADNTASSTLSAPIPCVSSSASSHSCKVFLIPKAVASSTPSSSSALEIPLAEAATRVSGGEQDQILVFQFHGRFHAVDNVRLPSHLRSYDIYNSSHKQRCPHEAYPLCNGAPFDIEDFGIKLSSGITCSKHGWSFDLVTGRGDRGNSKLGIWDVEVRPCSVGLDGDDTEIWVRRKKRIG